MPDVQRDRFSHIFIDGTSDALAEEIPNGVFPDMDQKPARMADFALKCFGDQNDWQRGKQIFERWYGKFSALNVEVGLLVYIRRQEKHTGAHDESGKQLFPIAAVSDLVVSKHPEEAVEKEFRRDSEQMIAV